jgi:hypothetical protein
MPTTFTPCKNLHMYVMIRLLCLLRKELPCCRCCLTDSQPAQAAHVTAAFSLGLRFHALGRGRVTGQSLEGACVAMHINWASLVLHESYNVFARPCRFVKFTARVIDTGTLQKNTVVGSKHSHSQHVLRESRNACRGSWHLGRCHTCCIL